MTQARRDTLFDETEERLREDGDVLSSNIDITALADMVVDMIQERLEPIIDLLEQPVAHQHEGRCWGAAGRECPEDEDAHMLREEINDRLNDLRTAAGVETQ